MADIIDENFTISFITYIEFLGYKDVKKGTEEFVNIANMIEIDKSIIRTCIELRKASILRIGGRIILLAFRAFGK